MSVLSHLSNCGQPMAGRGGAAHCQALAAPSPPFLRLRVCAAPGCPAAATAPSRRPGMGAGTGTMSVLGSPVRAYDFLLKFLLVGDSDVGKGEILESLQDGAAESPYGHPAGERGPGSGAGSAGPGAGAWAREGAHRGRGGAELGRGRGVGPACPCQGRAHTTRALRPHPVPHVGASGGLGRAWRRVLRLLRAVCAPAGARGWPGPGLRTEGRRRRGGDAAGGGGEAPAGRPTCTTHSGRMRGGAGTAGAGQSAGPEPPGAGSGRLLRAWVAWEKSERRRRRGPGLQAPPGPRVAEAPRAGGQARRARSRVALERAARAGAARRRGPGRGGRRAGAPQDDRLDSGNPKTGGLGGGGRGRAGAAGGSRVASLPAAGGLLAPAPSWGRRPAAPRALVFGARSRPREQRRAAQGGGSCLF